MWDEIQISSHDLIRWMDVVRSMQGPEQYRVLESFWASQVRSKAWMINALRSTLPPYEQIWDTAFIFGGWYGVAGTLLKRQYPNMRVVSIDIDPQCGEIGRRMNPDIEFVTCDMAWFADYWQSNHSLVINTSTEHVDQYTFDRWRGNIPKNRGSHLVLQGNNFASIPEHIRCATSFVNFMGINHIDQVVYKGVLDCVQFERYLSIERIPYRDPA